MASTFLCNRCGGVAQGNASDGDSGEEDDFGEEDDPGADDSYPYETFFIKGKGFFHEDTIDDMVKDILEPWNHTIKDKLFRFPNHMAKHAWANVKAFLREGAVGVLPPIDFRVDESIPKDERGIREDFLGSNPRLDVTKFEVISVPNTTYVEDGELKVGELEWGGISPTITLDVRGAVTRGRAFEIFETTDDACLTLYVRIFEPAPGEDPSARSYDSMQEIEIAPRAPHAGHRDPQ